MKTDIDESLLESQLIDWMDGLGATKDASDIAQAFVDKLGVTENTATKMLASLILKREKNENVN